MLSAAVSIEVLPGADEAEEKRLKELAEIRYFGGEFQRLSKHMQDYVDGHPTIDSNWLMALNDLHFAQRKLLDRVGALIRESEYPPPARKRGPRPHIAG